MLAASRILGDVVMYGLFHSERQAEFHAAVWAVFRPHGLLFHSDEIRPGIGPILEAAWVLSTSPAFVTSALDSLPWPPCAELGSAGPLANPLSLQEVPLRPLQ